MFLTWYVSPGQQVSRDSSHAGPVQYSAVVGGVQSIKSSHFGQIHCNTAAILLQNTYIWMLTVVHLHENKQTHRCGRSPLLGFPLCFWPLQTPGSYRQNWQADQWWWRTWQKKIQPHSSSVHLREKTVKMKNGLLWNVMIMECNEDCRCPPWKGLQVILYPVTPGVFFQASLKELAPMSTTFTSRTVSISSESVKEAAKQYGTTISDTRFDKSHFSYIIIIYRWLLKY